MSTAHLLAAEYTAKVAAPAGDASGASLTQAEASPQNGRTNSEVVVMAAPTVDQPLGGLRVVEVSTFVAAPLGGMTLAQLGAEVVRVDPLGGAPDHSRWPLAPSGTSLYWTGLNKAKRSIAVDLRSAAGQELVTRLVTGSGPGGGIVLTNSVGRPAGWATRRWRGAGRTSSTCRSRATPTAAPRSTTRSTPALGFPLLTGPAGHADPVNHVLPAWDVACGLYAAVGLLGALRRRTLTGEGQALSVALSDVALATAGNLGFLAEAELGRAPAPDRQLPLRRVRPRLHLPRRQPDHARHADHPALAGPGRRDRPRRHRGGAGAARSASTSPTRATGTSAASCSPPCSSAGSAGATWPRPAPSWPRPRCSGRSTATSPSWSGPASCGPTR